MRPPYVLGLTFAAVLLAWISRWLLDPLLGDHLPFATFFVAVIFSAWVGGLRPALLATSLGFFLSLYYFVPPRHSINIPSGPHFVGLVLYVIVCLAIAGFGETMYAVRRRLISTAVGERAEEQLRESEARYRALVEASAAIVWQTDPDGAVIFADNAWNVVTGQTDEQKGGWGWLDVIHPDDRSRTIALWKHSLETRTVHVNKFRVRTLSGDNRWFSVRGVPIFNSDGSVHVWVGANTDIHDEMISEIAMRESEERLNGILRQSPAGIVQTDDTGRMTLVNPRWCEMLGYSEAELIGKSVFDVTHASSVEATRAAIDRLAAGGPDFQIEKNYCCKDGSLLIAQSNVTALRSPEGKFLGLIAVVLDISEQQRIEGELREKAHFLERVAEIMPGVLQVFDLGERRSVFINRTVTSLLGYSPEEVQAMGTEVVPTLMHPDDLPRFEQHLASVRALCDGEVSNFEHRMRDRAGGWHWFHSHDAVFARDTAGAVRQIIGVATDISERKRTAEAVARLAAIVESSHDALFSIDIDGIVTSWNRGAERIFGYSADEMVGKSVMQLIPEAQRAEEHEYQRKIAAGDFGGTFEAIRQAKDGRQFHAAITLSPLKNAAGEVIGSARVVRFGPPNSLQNGRRGSHPKRVRHASREPTSGKFAGSSSSSRTAAGARSASCRSGTGGNRLSLWAEPPFR